MQEFKITEQAIKNLINYLAQKPLSETIGLISAGEGRIFLNGVSQLKPPVDKKEKANGNSGDKNK